MSEPIFTPPLLGHSAHVWLRFVAGEPTLDSGDLRVLSPVELDHAARFRRDADRHLYIAAHGFLRRVLGAYRQVAPESIRFIRSPGGRPEVSGEGLRFNLSHTRGLVACIVTESVECGVDVEQDAAIDDPLLLSRHVLSSTERAGLSALEKPAQRDRFLTLWTLKEAYVKARGMGLALPLDRITFRMEHGAILLELDSDLEEDISSWRFHAERVATEHRLAIAVRSSSPLRSSRGDASMRAYEGMLWRVLSPASVPFRR